MAETKNIDVHTNYGSLLHDTQESKSSLDSRSHQKLSLFHLIPPSQSDLSNNLIYQSLILKGKLGNKKNGNRANTFSFGGKVIRDSERSANIRRQILHSCLGVFLNKSVYRRKQCYQALGQYYLTNSDLRKFKPIKTSNNVDVYNSVRFRNRRLLSGVIKSRQNLENSPKSRRKKQKSQNEPVNKPTESRTNIKHRTELLPLNVSSNVTNTSKVNLEKLALQELKEYEEFVSMMEQTFSKDPLRAMLSVSCLMIVLMLAVKLCGMKPVKQEREILDFHENVQYENIHDILKRKRPYLPKYLLAWERRLRRKFKRRQRIRRVREQEQVDNVISDNSEEEMLIYGGNCDF